jgi:hypothetical protein
VAHWGERTWDQAEGPVWEGRISRGEVKREAHPRNRSERSSWGQAEGRALASIRRLGGSNVQWARRSPGASFLIEVVEDLARMTLGSMRNARIFILAPQRAQVKGSTS